MVSSSGETLHQKYSPTGSFRFSNRSHEEFSQHDWWIEFPWRLWFLWTIELRRTFHHLRLSKTWRPSQSLWNRIHPRCPEKPAGWGIYTNLLPQKRNYVTRYLTIFLDQSLTNPTLFQRVSVTFFHKIAQTSNIISIIRTRNYAS